LAKNWRFWLNTKPNYVIFWSKHCFLRKAPIFSPIIVEKTQKFLIITSTPRVVQLVKWKKNPFQNSDL
jgi:hypothetical protein